MPVTRNRAPLVDVLVPLHGLDDCAGSHAAALPAALEELAVESVAFVVSAAAGLDVSCEAVPYVASFGGEDAVEQLERCAQAIDAIAGRIEDALELRPKPAEESSAKQGLDRVEPAVDRAPA